jgi:signal transduction histidine kinase
MSEGRQRSSDELEAELQQRDAELEAVRRISAALCQATKVDELVRLALDTSLHLVGAEAGSVILYDADKDKLVFKYVVGEAADSLAGMHLSPDQGLAGAVFHSGQINVSEDVSTNATHDRAVGETVDYLTTNMVTVPLLCVDRKALGVMQVLNKADGVFEDKDVALLDILGSQIAAALETARLHEEARLAEVVRFIGNLSHDVKNMMTPVQTAGETLELVALDTWADFDAAVIALPNREQIADSVEGLRELLPEMTEMIAHGCDAVHGRMAEVSAAVKGVVTEPHFCIENIRTVVDQVVPMLALVAQRENVTIESDIPQDVEPAVMDPKQIYNALYNLVNNALQAYPPGATVTVRCSSKYNGTFPEGGYLQVAVQDTGTGMPEEVRSKLFTDDAISTKPMGTGLGTRIVKNVVDAHGGTVWVESVMGQGTTITFRIPLEGSPEARARMRAAQLQREGQ